MAEQSATTLEQQTVQAGESNEITDPFGLKDTAEPPEPKTAEEAVAIAVAEQNLLDRIRAGFAMTDADRVAIDREVAWFARHDDYLDRTFRRAERYLYFIVGELEERKMPLELALLPIVESAFNPVAQSRARAAGLWQFIPSTGRRFGLEQNRQYDGRRDVMESTRAALAYLQFLATEFDGDWQLAVAAYNCGELNVSRAIKRNQARGKPIDFFSLDLPRETRAYVPKLLAMRRIVAQPEKYGIAFVRDIANKQYFAKVEVDEPIDLGVAARLAGMSLEDLIVLNPAYRRAVTTADGPGYILVPTAHEEQLRSALSELQSPDQRVPKSRYTVNRGDTVASVARKLGVKPDELIATNKIKNNTLRVGQELVVIRGSVSTRVAEVDQSTGERFVTRDPSYVPPPLPPPEKRSRSSDAGGRYTVHSGETLWSIARDHGVSVEALAMENKLNSKSHIVKGQKLWIPPISFEGANTLASTNLSSDSVEKITYVVRGGDTLAKIAKAFRVEMKDLLTWNKLKSNDVIKVGQKLVMYVIDMRRSGG
ncbi:MAG TPA: LysM peptidoglycan-binding domain-containing protein [Steroidobacteraceae bacterium]|nr:LysM peptidoglycan-binding domain-containing protein [Steroidobacteraceae bacterium]